MTQDQMLDLARNILTVAAPLLVLAAAHSRRSRPVPVTIDGPSARRMRFAVERDRAL